MVHQYPPVPRSSPAARDADAEDGRPVPCPLPRALPAPEPVFVVLRSLPRAAGGGRARARPRVPSPVVPVRAPSPRGSPRPPGPRQGPHPPAPGARSRRSATDSYAGGDPFWVLLRVSAPAEGQGAGPPPRTPQRGGGKSGAGDLGLAADGAHRKTSGHLAPLLATCRRAKSTEKGSTGGPLNGHRAEEVLLFKRR